MQTLSTVCMILDPYRNLTTLTASVLALHPEISVLNHGGERVFSNPEIDFTRGHTEQKFNAFCDFALEAAKGEKKGSYGGSITLSHAFKTNPNIRDQYIKLYEHGKTAPAKCLLWKESHRLLYHLKTNDFDFEGAFAANGKIRFLIPIRNIFDSACSKYVTGHFTIGYTGVRNDPAYISGTQRERTKSIDSQNAQSIILEIIEMLLTDLELLHQLRKKFPGRFLFFFEHEPAEQIFANILDFLMLTSDSHPIHSEFTFCQTKYRLSNSMKAEILKKIDEHLSDYSMRSNLHQFFE